MPANLTPDYLAAESRFRAAETTEEKLAALDEMYATIPKHKGTEKLRADIKRRISKLKEKERLSGKAKRFDEFHIVREGAGQIVLVGPPNSGKSSLFGRFTSAVPEIADYPFTTRAPIPGMMEYQDIHIQLVDIPPISGLLEGHGERGIDGLVRNADAVAMVVDASDDALLDKIGEIREELATSKAVLVGEGSAEFEPPAGTVSKPTLIVANKTDLPGARENCDVLREFYCGEFAIEQVSALTGEGLEGLKDALFNSLGIIRVYTKVPGKPADLSKPFTIKKGSALIDFAATVHKDFVKTLRFARAWGDNTLDGVKIGRDHVLEDGCVVELHT